MYGCATYWATIAGYLIYLFLGETSLMKAAENISTDIVKILIEHGATVNDRDIKG